MTERQAYTVRPAKASDENGWRRLWRGYCEFYRVTVPGDVTDLLWHRILDPHVQIHALVAEEAPGRLVGVANYVLHPFTWGRGDVCYLEDLFVTSQARGQGVGRALIEALIAMARQE